KSVLDTNSFDILKEKVNSERLNNGLQRVWTTIIDEHGSQAAKQKRKRDDKENTTTNRTRNESTKVIRGYSTWTFKAVCKLYKLADEDVDDPTLSVFSLLKCGNTEANNEGLQHLLLDLSLKSKYISLENEASRSHLVAPFYWRLQVISR
ncbi:3551_t:CDS:2, partial [Gigaspora rosea]